MEFQKRFLIFYQKMFVRPIEDSVSAIIVEVQVDFDFVILNILIFVFSVSNDTWQRNILG